MLSVGLPASWLTPTEKKAPEARRKDLFRPQASGKERRKTGYFGVLGVPWGMGTAPEKVPLSAKFDDSRTAHLQPLIDLLKAQGNPPWVAPRYRPVGADGFYFDRDGYGTFYFEQPLNLAALAARFDLPDTVVLGQTAVYDRRNFVGISQAIPQKEPLRFDR